MMAFQNWFRSKTNSAKRAWNHCSETFRDVVLTISAMTLGSGKFLKDIGSKMFFMTSLFAPIIGSSNLGVGFNDALAVVFVLGISYTNYLTSYSSLKYRLIKNFKVLKIDDSIEEHSHQNIDEESLLLSTQQHDIQRVNLREHTVSYVVDINDESVDGTLIDPNVSNFQKFKNGAYRGTLHLISKTRMFFVVSDTYLGINKLYKETAGLFGKTLSPNTLNTLTNTSGTYFAFSDGIMYLSYSDKILLANGNKLKNLLSLDNLKQATKWKLGLAGIFSAFGILTKGIKDLFTISVSLGYVPFIKRLPPKSLTNLGYLGGASSIASKSIYEGIELGNLIYNPEPFIQNTRDLTSESALTYLKLFAFLLNSGAEAASGYQALEWLFESTGLTEELESLNILNQVQIPCAVVVALSVAALEFAVNVRSLSMNKKHAAEIEVVSSAIPPTQDNALHFSYDLTRASSSSSESDVLEGITSYPLNTTSRASP